MIGALILLGLFSYRFVPGSEKFFISKNMLLFRNSSHVFGNGDKATRLVTTVKTESMSSTAKPTASRAYLQTYAYMDLFNFASDLKNYWFLVTASLREEDIDKRREDIIQEGYRVLQKQVENFTMATVLPEEIARQKFLPKATESSQFESVYSELEKLRAIVESTKSQNKVPDDVYVEVNAVYRRIHGTVLLMMNATLSSRETELENLRKTVQDKIEQVQNPDDCSKARLQICEVMDACGYGCQLHWVTNCFMDAFKAGRAVVYKTKGWLYSRQEGWDYAFQSLGKCTFEGKLNELHGTDRVEERIVRWGRRARKPQVSYTIPSQLAPTLLRHHSRPNIWWISQFVSYLTKYKPWLQESIDKHASEIGIGSGPIVGLHIRRGAKVRIEAKRFEIADYMFFVEQWYLVYEATHKAGTRKVYVATDDKTVLPELKSKYPGYTFITNNKNVDTYNEVGLESIVTDVHFLSRSDFVVCTSSSNVCRLVQEAMAALNVDAPMRIQSLDDPYHFTNGGEPMVAILNHTDAGGHGDLEFVAGDQLDVKINDFYRMKTGLLKQEEFVPYNNGFRRGENMRNSKQGILPTYKARRTYIRESYYVFDQTL